jgi:hypothetical protein
MIKAQFWKALKMNKWLVLLVGLLVSSGALKDVRADEASLQKQLDEQQKEIEGLKGRMDKANDKTDENVKWSGDLRYRHEMVDQEGSDDYHRHRIRARITMDARVNEWVDMTVRLASGSSDPVSTNQTLGDKNQGEFSSMGVWLDQAFMTIRPAVVKGSKIVAGKVKNPFYCAGGNQLIWDSDLNPDGGAVSYTRELGEKTSLNLVGGGFWVEERHGDATFRDVDVSLWGAQGYIEHAIGNPTTLVAGISYYDYGNIQGATEITAFGNSATGGGALINDYDLLEVFAGLTDKIGDMPVSVFGSFVQNMGTVSGYNQDTGYILGCTLNKAKKPGSWQVGYDYRDLENDAVVGQFSDSDFIGGGTGGQGHRFTGAYQIAQNMQAAVTYFMNTIDGSPDLDYNRLQLDIVIKAK